MKKRWWLLGVALMLGALALVASACAPTPAAPAVTPPSGQATQAPKPAAATAQPAAKPVASELTLVGALDIKTLDPPVGTAVSDQDLAVLIFDTLVTLDPAGKIQPALAESWKVSDDSLTWTLSLRKNAKFSDGSPVTARDVKFTFERLLDPETKSGRRASFAGVLAEVGAPNESTVTLKTKAPFPDLSYLLMDPAASITSEAAVKAAGKDVDRKPVGTGPLMLKEWVPGDHLTLVPNPYYWGQTAISKLTFKPVPEGAARAAMLQRGEADIVLRLPPEDIQGLKGAAGVDVIAKPTQFSVYLEMNNVRPPLNDVRVRQAINYAVDKEAIVKNILLGVGQVTKAPLPPDVFGRVELEPYKYDPEKAKALLKEAGWEKGFKTKIWTVTGRYLKGEQVTQAVQGYLAKIGVETDYQSIEIAKYDVASGDPATSDKGLYMFGRIGTYPDYHLTRLFHSSNRQPGGGGGGASNNGYSNPEVDKLIEKARFTFDDKERAQLYKQIQETIWKDAPFLWLHDETQVLGVRKNVQGVILLPSGGVWLRNAKKS